MACCSSTRAWDRTPRWMPATGHGAPTSARRWPPQAPTLSTSHTSPTAACTSTAAEETPSWSVDPCSCRRGGSWPKLAEARNTADYTPPELLDGGRFEELDGEAEVLPGVFLIPTPGQVGDLLP